MLLNPLRRRNITEKRSSEGFESMHERWRVAEAVRIRARMPDLLVDLCRTTAEHADLVGLK